MTDTRERTVEEKLDQWIEASLTAALEAVGDEPRDQEQADRLLWALRGVRRRRAETVEVARARVQMVTTWASHQTDQLDARAAHLERLLEGWAQAECERTGRKTWSLPAGTLKVRARTIRAVATSAAQDVLVQDEIAQKVPAAVIEERRVLPGEVKRATKPGLLVDAAALGIDVPDGYEAHLALLHYPITHDANGDRLAEPGEATTVVPGVVLLVPVDGRAGQQFSAVTS